jgi:hypothetical protein
MNQSPIVAFAQHYVAYKFFYRIAFSMIFIVVVTLFTLPANAAWKIDGTRCAGVCIDSYNGTIEYTTPQLACESPEGSGIRTQIANQFGWNLSTIGTYTGAPWEAGRTYCNGMPDDRVFARLIEVTGGGDPPPPPPPPPNCAATPCTTDDVVAQLVAIKAQQTADIQALETQLSDAVPLIFMALLSVALSLGVVAGSQR